jgi:hypothetical protein
LITDRRTVAIGLPALLVASHAHPATASAPGAVGDWAFLRGSWRVHHRRPVPAGSDDWKAFDGTMTHVETMGSQGNVEDYVINAPTGTYRAMSIRAFDLKTRLWSIWWIDSRYPTTRLLPPMRGRFEGDHGLFTSEGMDQGRRVLGRFMWTGIRTETPRWEQATSRDDGATWQPNWIMELSRAARL